jgi:hypothetical protein
LSVIIEMDARDLRQDLQLALVDGVVTEQMVDRLVKENRKLYESKFDEILSSAVDQRNTKLVEKLFSESSEAKDQIVAHVFRRSAFVGNDFMVNWIIARVTKQRGPVRLLSQVYRYGLSSPSETMYLWLKNECKLREHAAAILANSKSYALEVGDQRAIARYRDLGLSAQLLRAAIINKWMDTIKKFADEPELVRKVCLADGGAVLRRVWKKKLVIRLLFKIGVSRSDCVSIGLLWTEV